MFFIALAFIALKNSLTTTLWCAAFLGAIADVFSDDPIGLSALSFTLSAWILHRLNRYLLPDSPFHFMLFTALFAAVCNFLYLPLLFLFDRRVPFDGKWALTDLLIAPLAYATIAWVGFVVPVWTLKTIRSIGGLIWLQKKSRRRSRT